MKALDQTGHRSLKPKQITWCLLRLMVAGLLQVFGVVWVGKKVHPEHARGAGELQAKGTWGGGKLHANCCASSVGTPFKEQL